MDALDEELENALGGSNMHVGEPTVERTQPSSPETHWYDSVVGNNQSRGYDDELGKGQAQAIAGLVNGASAHTIDANSTLPERASPGAETALDVGGSMMLPNPASIGGAMASQGAQGVVRSLADGGDLKSALGSGGIDAAITGLLGGAGKAIGGAGKWLGDAADSSRLKAMGVGADEVAARASREGLPTDQAVKNFVGKAEELVPPNRFMGRSASEIEQQARPAAEGQNALIDSALADAQAGGAQMPMDPRGQAAQSLYGQADAAAESGFNAHRQPSLSTVAQNVERGPQSYSPQDLRKQKSGYDANAFKGGPGTPEALAGQANLAAGNEYRGMLNDYVGQAGPDVQQAYQGANQGYGVAATVRDSAADLARKQAAGGGLLSKMAGPAMGAVAGGGLAAMTGNNVAAGALGGAGIGYGARSAMGSPDFAANMGRMGESAANGVGGALGAASRAPMSALTQPLDNTKGHELGDDIHAALERDPNVFGEFTDDIASLSDEQQTAKVESLLRNPDTAKEFAPIYARIMSQR